MAVLVTGELYLEKHIATGIATKDVFDTKTCKNTECRLVSEQESCTPGRCS